MLPLCMQVIREMTKPLVLITLGVVFMGIAYLTWRDGEIRTSGRYIYRRGESAMFWLLLTMVVLMSLGFIVGGVSGVVTMNAIVDTEATIVETLPLDNDKD